MAPFLARLALFSLADSLVGSLMLCLEKHQADRDCFAVVLRNTAAVKTLSAGKNLLESPRNSLLYRWCRLNSIRIVKQALISDFAICVLSTARR